MFKRTTQSVDEIKRPRKYICPRCSGECKLGGYIVICSTCNMRMDFHDYNLTKMRSIYFNLLDYDVKSYYDQNITYIYKSEKEVISFNQAVNPKISEDKIKLYVLFS